MRRHAKSWHQEQTAPKAEGVFVGFCFKASNWIKASFGFNPFVLPFLLVQMGWAKVGNTTWAKVES